MVEPLRYHGPCDGCCVPAIEATEFLEAHVLKLEEEIHSLEIFLQAQGYHKCKVDGWTKSRCSCQEPQLLDLFGDYKVHRP